VLAALRPDIREAGGVVTVDARVAGTAAKPQVTGDGTLSNGWLALRDYPVPLHNIRGRFTATPQGVRLAELTALLGGGEIRASGDVGLKDGGLGAYRLKVQARRVAVESIERLSTTWDADLEVVGLGARAQLRGDARLLHGSYVDESSVLRLLLGSRGGGGGATTAGALPIDLRVHLDDNFVVRTAVTRFRAGGTLNVQGTTAAPVLFGTVEVRDGFLLFQRQRFTLASASARFVDPRRIDPMLDVEATARIQGYDVTVRMKGRVEDLEMRLSSSPPLPQDDLLSLVAFGQTAAQVGKSGAGTAVAGEAVALVVQELFGVRTAGAIDVLEVDTSDASKRAVKVGKRINEKTLVVYSQGVDRWDERKLRVEYQVLGPLAVAGEQDFRGGFGADVLLRLRFR
jgi:translocation and assembly module TamB